MRCRIRAQLWDNGYGVNVWVEMIKDTSLTAALAVQELFYVMTSLVSNLSPCLVGIEACATSHYWSRELQALRHCVRLTIVTG